MLSDEEIGAIQKRYFNSVNGMYEYPLGTREDVQDLLDEIDRLKKLKGDPTP